MRMNWRLDPSRLLLALSKTYRPEEKFTTLDAKKRGVHVHHPYMYYLTVSGLLSHDHVVKKSARVNRYWIPLNIHRKIQDYEDEIISVYAGDVVQPK